MPAFQKITPFLWFDTQAEEAATFYCSLFPDSRIVAVSRYGEVGPGPKGSVMTVELELAGLKLVALNGGPHFKFTEAISLAVTCEDQQEVDHLWDRLSRDGGAESMCGWLKDRWGLSWQIVPRALLELMQDPDAARAQRVMKAMLGMRKIDVAGLQRAAEGA
jgi:predicted 3-demethylubiquinone-9 3-methyltransferase (glyoxalase superfamily)